MSITEAKNLFDENRALGDLRNILHRLQLLKDDLHKIDANEIVSFYRQVGKNFERNLAQIRKTLLEETLYDGASIDDNLPQMPYLFNTVGDLLDTLGTIAKDRKEGRHFLDGWFIKENGPLSERGDPILVHAEPLGIIGEIGVANAFPMNYLMIVLSTATKNPTVFKASTRDVPSVRILKETMIDVDRKFPLTLGFEYISWPHGWDTGEQYLVDNVNGIVYSGREPAIKQLRRLSSSNTASTILRSIEFPPRYGLQFVQLPQDANKLEKISHSISKDIYSSWFQNACYAPLILYLSGNNPEEFLIHYLGPKFGEYSKMKPFSKIPIELKESIRTKRLMSIAKGYRCLPSLSSESQGRVLYKKGIEFVPEHCGGMTLYTFIVDDIMSAVKAPNVTPAVQTVGIYVEDKEKRRLVKNSLSYQGVDRITDIGQMSPKSLTLHDGLFQVHRFVRWVSDETSSL